jgi:Ran GTPase-activating protein (RanGAP) involved in mRNA processing and transport
MEYVCQVLETRESKKDSYRVYSLNFDFCYLERAVFSQLTKALTGNLSLVKLVLSHNNLGEEAVNEFLVMLASNLALVDVNLSGNLLEDDFAVSLSICLRKN